MGHPLRDIHDQALRDLEQMMPAAAGLEWLGVKYPCVRSSRGESTHVEWGGRLYEIKFALTVRKAAAAGAAQPFSSGKILCYDGVKYRIADVKDPAPGASWHLTLIDPNV